MSRRVWTPGLTVPSMLFAFNGEECAACGRVAQGFEESPDGRWWAVHLGSDHDRLRRCLVRVPGPTTRVEN